MSRNVEIFLAYLDRRQIAFALTEQAALELAQKSHWFQDSKGTVTVVPTTVRLHEIDAELKYSDPHHTNHVCWQCPVCDSWYSDDYVDGDTPPTLASCTWTRKHPDGNEVWTLLNWRSPPNDFP